MSDDVSESASASTTADGWYQHLKGNRLAAFSLHRVVFDDAGAPVDLTLEDVNEKYEELMATPRARLVGRTLRQINPDADRARITQFAQVATTGEPLFMRYQSSTFQRDFSVYTFSPQPGWICSLTQDVSAERVAQQRIDQGEQRLQSIVEHLDELIWLRSDDEMLYINPRSEQVMGVSAENYHNNPSALLDAVHEDDRERVAAVVRAGARSGASYTLDYRVRHKSGEVRWVRSQSHPLPHEPGLRVGIARDITADKLHEAQLDDARRTADAANRAKSQFLATMSHEIRTPMHAVIGLVDQLLADGPRDDQRDALETLQSSAGSLLALLNNVLDYTKIEAGRVELERVAFEPREVLAAIVRGQHKRALDQGTALAVDVDDDVPHVLVGDPVRFGQVATNLAANAIKFTAAGHVRVQLSRVAGLDVEGRVPLRLAVSDTGIGIEPAQLPRLFEAFVQAQADMTRRYGGTGLGLAICARLAALMGGRIDVTSRVGEGSTFTFTVALPAGEARTSTVARSMAAVDGLVGLRVLVVDDNVVNLKIACRMLERWGVRVVQAQDGAQAVQLAASEPFDVILMDLHMPVLDGFQATVAIRRFDTAVHILAYTADALSDVRKQAMECGMNDVVTKPFAPADLATRLSACRRAAE